MKWRVNCIVISLFFVRILIYWIAYFGSNFCIPLKNLSSIFVLVLELMVSIALSFFNSSVLSFLEFSSINRRIQFSWDDFQLYFGFQLTCNYQKILLEQSLNNLNFSKLFHQNLKLFKKLTFFLVSFYLKNSNIWFQKYLLPGILFSLNTLLLLLK